MDAIALAEALEKWVSLAVFLLAAALGTLSLLAWRRERARRMLAVSVGYSLIGLFGLAVFLEPTWRRLFGFGVAEVVEHGASVLILAGLVAFFLAIGRE